MEFIEAKEEYLKALKQGQKEQRALHLQGKDQEKRGQSPEEDGAHEWLHGAETAWWGLLAEGDELHLKNDFEQ